MTACEECWNAAFRRSQMFGGLVVDHYAGLLHEPFHESHAATPAGPSTQAPADERKP